MTAERKILLAIDASDQAENAFNCKFDVRRIEPVSSIFTLHCDGKSIGGGRDVCRGDGRGMPVD